MIHKKIALLIMLMFNPLLHGMTQTEQNMIEWNLTTPLYVPNQEQPKKLVTMYLPIDLWYNIVITSQNLSFYLVNKFFKAYIEYWMRQEKIRIPHSIPAPHKAKPHGAPQSPNIPVATTTVFHTNSRVDENYRPMTVSQTNGTNPLAKTYHVLPMLSQQRKPIAIPSTTPANKAASLAAPKSPLHQAAEDGDLKEIEVLIRNGTYVDTPDDSGRTPLVTAIQNKQLAAVQLLHESGADIIQAQTASAITPIHYAIGAKDLPIIRYLVKHGADLGYKSQAGRTFLHSAVNIHCDASILECLLEPKVIPVNHRDNDHATALLIACKKGLTPLAELLIKYGADVNLGDDRNLLCDIAYKYGNVPIIKLLRNHGALTTICVDSATFEASIANSHVHLVEKFLALGTVKVTQEIVNLALTIGNEEVIDLLLNAQCDAPSQTSASDGNLDSDTIVANQTTIVASPAPSTDALYDACVLCDTDVIDNALPLGANKDILNNVLSKLVCFALKANNLETIYHLVSRGADLSYIDKLGNTYVHTAIECSCHCDTVRYLLERNKNALNKTNDFEETPLIMACKKGLYKIVQTLIADGADISGKNTKDMPCNIAYAHKWYDVVHLLRFHGAPHTIQIPPHTLRQAIAQQDIPWVKALISLGAPVDEPALEVACSSGNRAMIELVFNAQT